MSPLFGLEVGGTVVQIDIGPYESCPLKYDTPIVCLFESENHPDRFAPGTFVPPLRPLQIIQSNVYLLSAERRIL